MNYLIKYESFFIFFYWIYLLNTCYKHSKCLLYASIFFYLRVFIVTNIYIKKNIKKFYKLCISKDSYSFPTYFVSTTMFIMLQNSRNSILIINNLWYFNKLQKQNTFLFKILIKPFEKHYFRREMRVLFEACCANIYIYIRCEKNTKSFT